MSHAPHLTIVELTGHIIDSLTLAKVIDKIQHRCLQYQINDLQIGQRKNDVSTAQISIWCDNSDELRDVLTELKAYGAVPVLKDEAHLQPCPADGKLPADAYLRHHPPTEVLIGGKWLKVAAAGYDTVIVVDADDQHAHLCRSSDVRKGDRVVVGHAGVKVLPMLGGKRKPAATT
jgi:hypothetical protein